MSHFNQLTAAEDERLALLLEELGESIHIIGKIQRHGYEGSNPNFPSSYDLTNRKRLVEELGDVLVAIDFLLSNCDIDIADINDRCKVKRVKVWNFLHEQGGSRQGVLLDLLASRS